MKAVVVSLITFACIFGGTVIGMGLVATMAALVLGFLIAGAQSSFRDQRGDLIEMSANIVFLDKLLADYGPGTKEARAVLKSSLERTIYQFWPEDGSEPARLGPEEARTETLYYKIQSLKPGTDAERSLVSEALSITYDLAQARDALLMGQSKTIPGAFVIVLAMLVFWFAAIFFSFGLYAPTNATVVSTLILSALSVALALFIILELNRPFEGLLRMPSEPLVEALEHIGK